MKLIEKIKNIIKNADSPYDEVVSEGIRDLFETWALEMVGKDEKIGEPSLMSGLLNVANGVRRDIRQRIKESTK